jgi:hypothetical protein
MPQQDTKKTKETPLHACLLQAMSCELLSVSLPAVDRQTAHACLLAIKHACRPGSSLSIDAHVSVSPRTCGLLCSLYLSIPDRACPLAVKTRGLLRSLYLSIPDGHELPQLVRGHRCVFRVLGFSGPLDQALFTAAPQECFPLHRTSTMEAWTACRSRHQGKPALPGGQTGSSAVPACCWRPQMRAPSQMRRGRPSGGLLCLDW